MSFLEASTPLQDAGGRIKSGNRVFAQARICSRQPRLRSSSARFANATHRANGALGPAGTTGAAGATGLAGAGAAGALGAAGSSGDGPPSSTIERGARVGLPSATSRMPVAKNRGARIGVVRVRK